VDDKPVGITPWTGELTPGAHTLKLVRSGYEPAIERLELSLERAVDVSVQLTQAQPKPTVAVPPRPARQLVPAPAAPHGPARSEAAHGPGATIHIWTWGVLGASAAALGGAGVYELFRRNAESEVSRHDTQLARLDEYQDMKHYQRDARILLGIGGGLALVGGGLLLWDLSSTARAPGADAEHRAHGSSDVVSARVGCDGLVCGLFMHGRLP
jgi:hypothetical protein